MGKRVTNLGQEVLYHITPTRLVSTIMREGLRASSAKGENTSGMGGKKRIYLAYYQSDLRELLDELRERSGSRDPFTMLEVRLPPKVKVYEDEDTFGSETYVYTTSNIPPKYIKVIEQVVSRRQMPSMRKPLLEEELL